MDRSGDPEGISQRLVPAPRTLALHSSGHAPTRRAARLHPGARPALRLGGALRPFWWGRGHWSEGRAFLERALAAARSLPGPRIDPSVRAKALMAAANLAFVQSDYAQTEVLCE